MSRFASLAAWAVVCYAGAGEPVRHVWMVNPKAVAGASSALARILPEVHSVAVGEDAVLVRSAGISLLDLGPLGNPPKPPGGARSLEFRIPRHPEPEAGRKASLPAGAIGAFVNGVPIYNQFEAASYQGRNLWHYDLVAAARGETRGLLRNLIEDSSRHSPILGFALDGYPVYGPWANGPGGLRRMRSSYRLRAISDRCTWPGGTRLTPGQCGPEVSERHPAGTFAEDYEFAPGAGDLDEYNGRFSVTPEYPRGTYAYFLATDSGGAPAFPYLLAHRYYGRVPLEPALPVRYSRAKVALRAPRQIEAGVPAVLSFEIGDQVRHPEHVHEKPIHVLVISEDLSTFEHIHPELTAADRFDVSHSFVRAGRYRVYADFTPPGSPQQIESFAIEVAEGDAPLRESEPGNTGIGLDIAMPLVVRAGEDVELNFALRDAASGGPPAGMEPFLGAWAHFVIVDREQSVFIHAHPVDEPALGAPVADLHIHGVTDTAGPVPSVIRTITSFPKSGSYKLWAQMQRNGRVITIPFLIDVNDQVVGAAARIAVPRNAVRLHVGRDGFTPAEIRVEAGEPLVLAIERDSAPNCGSRIVFPTLNRSVEVPLGGVAVVELPPLPENVLRFSCGMGMYRGSIVARK